ncbi:MAG: ImmA/IrrE family metallo-endopeptidase [Gammaproteobacteria bacterium]|nr:ImmA/IrrE family metallo-endopeptidase [Gammaproteobacteria bacterium]MCF6363394.1 ImmA/IrrE family metallo-endopeptidase [Gammaproteobacteria bacterium]
MTRVAVNPDLLDWALARADLSADALIKAFPKIHDWLTGEIQPTLKQLESFANKTHTAIGYLFLPEPPVETLPVPDFRTMANARLDHPTPDLLDTLYLCQQRQDWYRDYLRLHGEAAPTFVGSATIEDDVISVAARMRAVLSFDVEQRRSMPTWKEALRQFISLVEDAGVLVMVSGIVGSNTHRKLDPEEFRGFALVDDLAQLIFINGSDSKAAQMFTLAHELAHIWLGESGVSDAQAAVLPDEQTEHWCNAVAAELLAPMEAVGRLYQPDVELQDEMQRLARQFKVSTLVILRRFSDMGVLDRDAFWDYYHEELAKLRSLDRSGSGGGDFYNNLGARVSKRFARALVGSTLEGQTLFQDAFRMLNIRKSDTFYKEAERLGLRR